ncbi:MAG: N-acetyltransferase family protein [Candidatus Hydrogenedentales bacterium]
MPRLREATEDDAPAIAGIYAPYCEATPITFEIEAPSIEEMRARVGKVLPDYPWLVGELEGRVVGYAYASRHRERAAYRWGVDVGIYLDGGCHRRGLGRALYSALLKILVAQGYYTAYAGITLPNSASDGLHRAMGFEPVGVYHGAGYKGGAWHNVLWLEKSLQPKRPEPAEPIPASQLRGSPAWADALQFGEELLPP